MGYGYGAICQECQTKFDVNEGSGMTAMPFHCESCGKEWWWKFGPDGPFEMEADPPACECAGVFKVDAPPRCPKCRSTSFVRDPDEIEFLYD